MLMFYLPNHLTFVQITGQEEELNKALQKEKSKHYAAKELINQAAEKIADIYVRFMDKKNNK